MGKMTDSKNLLLPENMDVVNGSFYFVIRFLEVCYFLRRNNVSSVYQNLYCVSETSWDKFSLQERSSFIIICPQSPLETWSVLVNDEQFNPVCTSKTSFYDRSRLRTSRRLTILIQLQNYKSEKEKVRTPIRKRKKHRRFSFFSANISGH